MSLRRHIEAIEARRGSTVLVFAASHLEIDLLPELYDTLRSLEHRRAWTSCSPARAAS